MLYLCLGLSIALELATTSALQHGGAEPLLRAGGARLEAGLRALEEGQADHVVESCIRLSIFADKSDAHKNMVSQRGGVEGAVRAMRRLPENLQVQAQCAWFLAMVANNQAAVAPKKEIALKVGRSGAIEAAATAMRRYPEDGYVQDGGSIMFGCISDFSPENQLSLAAIGAPSLSVRAVQRFPERWGIWGGLAGMASLPSTARYLYEQGILGQAVRAMRANETRRAQRVRVECLCVLNQLARFVPESVEEIVGSGAIPEVFQELRDEPTGENLGNAIALFGMVGNSSAAGRAELARLGWKPPDLQK